MPMPMPIPRRHGWTRDLPDHRDRRFGLTYLADRPATVDLRPLCCPVYDQGALGSCTAHAIAAALRFLRKKQGLPDLPPSRLFVYFWERMLEGTVESDAGATIRDGIKVVAAYGIADEAAWPYDPARFKDDPPQACYASADKTHALRYERLSDLDEIRQSLALGYPVAFGFTVYEGFESDAVAASGIAAMPGPDEKPKGGHAVLAVGYDDAAGRLIVQNSWGTDWGQRGFFTLPYAYVASGLASDFWSLRQIAVQA